MQWCVSYDDDLKKVSQTWPKNCSSSNKPAPCIATWVRESDAPGLFISRRKITRTNLAVKGRWAAKRLRVAPTMAQSVNRLSDYCPIQYLHRIQRSDPAYWRVGSRINSTLAQTLGIIFFEIGWADSSHILTNIVDSHTAVTCWRTSLASKYADNCKIYLQGKTVA